MPDHGLLLPPGSRLVHIGFPKTGTTSLQSALEVARPTLPDHGVVYPGTGRYHRDASIAVVGATQRIGEPTPSPRHWDKLVDEVSAAGDQRVLVSSEWLCEADAAAVRKVVEDLGGERVHVVATLRPLTKILPSSWQQYVQNGARHSYETWLDGMLRKPPYTKPTPTFWRRHRHDEVIERWAEVVGPDRVTVIAVDQSDHALLLRQFEGLVGLPSGTLELQARTNASLSRSQAELVRRLNMAYREQEWPDDLYRSVVRIGIAEYLLRETPPTVKGPPITTPQWALERAAEIGAEAARRIEASGVRVVGDLGPMGQVPPPRADEGPGDPVMDFDLAVVALTGAMQAASDYGESRATRDFARLAREQARAAADARLTRRLRRVAGRARRRLRKVASPAPRT